MSFPAPSVPRNVRKSDAPGPGQDDALEIEPRAEEKRRPVGDTLREPPPSNPGGRRLNKELALLWAKRIAVAAAAMSALGLIAACALVRHYEARLPSVAELESGYHPSQVTRVLARDGTLLAELFTERRTVVSIDELPPHVKLALLGAEDANFYNHEGLNYLGIARAFLVNFRSGRTRQGGSTITQQVVKNILLETQERTYDRKMREALLARRLEQELCPACGSDEEGRRKRKDKILELYLNHIYFGNGRYGIEEAARHNFGKPARDLTIAEAAMLAGIPAGPELYSPKRDLKRALGRRSFVLDQMHTKGFLNDAQYEAAKDEPVRLAEAQEIESELAPEAVQIAKKVLFALEPERGPRGGFTITTTIDPRLQAATRKAVKDNLHAYDKRHGLTGPLKTTSVAKKGARPAKEPAVFEGTPSFDSHKTLTGVVVSADDVSGTIDVRVGTVLGSVKLSDYERYNPEKLPPSQFAPAGARLRVSLLAPVPNVVSQVNDKPGAPALSKVPLRLELGPQSSAVVLDVRTRHVLALVGSYEALSGGLDRATQSRRQPGSTFKPIVYSYALHARRYTPASLVDVQPTVFAGGYKPSNYEGWRGEDPLRLRDALANSVNIAAVRVLEDVGPANVVDWAKALGIRSTLKPDLSLALGSYEVQPIELAGAYATFAAGGMHEEPRIVTRIVGPDGEDVELEPPPPPHRVLEPAESYVTTSMLESVVQRGTGARAKAVGRPLAGKTGTSNEAKDTWFAGYSTEIAAVVWVGYDDNKPLGGGETGGSTALPAWVQLMKAAHENKPRAEFPKPPGVVTVAIDPASGKLAPPGYEAAIDEVFLEGTEPTETAEIPEPEAVLSPEITPASNAPAPLPMPAPAPQAPTPAHPPLPPSESDSL
jgi:penicillin-binding protein 1A